MTEASRHGYVTAAAEREVVSSDVVLLLGRVVLAACVEFFGALCVLVGLGTRYAAVLMAGFTLVAALIAHRFWEISDPAMYVNQMNHFLKNVTIVGGFLLLYAAGPGRLSVDRRGS